MEGTERGVIKDKELQIQWGDARRMIELIDAIGMGNGVGRFLGQGLAEVSRQLGTEDFAVHIKNVEVPLHEPRGKKGLAISYATSPRGATHLEAMHDTMLECENPTPELGVTKPVNRLSWGDKPRLCKIYEDLYSFVNSCILCGFVSWDQATAGQYYPFPVIRRILTAVTGIDVDTKAMLEIGERNYAIRRIVAAYDGYKITDDDLPQRLKEPLKSGACKGEKIDERELRKAIDEYYKLRGFDMYGPTDETLQRLVCAELVGIIKRPL
jgi:aldehyde:ferredoxin oxidoreductase